VTEAEIQALTEPRLITRGPVPEMVL